MILHVDMDAFYASVEQRDHAPLRGKPVIVGGAVEGRGVVCAASYEARQFGVHSAMPSGQAQRLCPHGVFLPPRMSHYAAVSRDIREIFRRYTPLVEPLSLDEAFLDVTGSEHLFGTAPEIARLVKSDIAQHLNLVASVGVAPNKFLAKIASDLDKPDGLVVVDPLRIEAFLTPLPVGRLWGVGRVTNKALDRLQVRTIGELRKLPLTTLHQLFGEHGDHLWQLAHGIDQREVVPDRSAKSISHETTFAIDIREAEVLRAWLLELSDQLGRRLRESKLAGRTVHLKVRFSDFRTITRSVTLGNSTNLTQELYDAARELFEAHVPCAQLPVRLLGVGVSRFGPVELRQTSLFDESAHQQQQWIDQASDQIRARFGHDSLARGSRLLHDTKHRAQPRPEDKSAGD